MFNYTKEQIEQMMWDVIVAFEWSQTPQGFDYWAGVHDNLKKLSEAQNENKELPS